MKKFIFDNLQELLGVTIGLTCGTVVGIAAFMIIVLAFAVLQST